MKKLKIKLLSSLAKAFPDKVYGKAIKSGEVAKGQSFYFQLAYFGEEAEYKLRIESELKKYITVYNVGFVPMTMPTYESCKDDDYLTKTVCDCPDPLLPNENNLVRVKRSNGALWFCVDLPADVKAGRYEICVSLLDKEKIAASKSLSLKVHDVALPKQELLFTQWFHVDCIANYHNVPVYSEEHWDLIEKYISIATHHGMNMILVPVLTPPLDTEVGGERTTVQLAKIEKQGDKYIFDMSLLERYIDICIKSNVEYFEINHMFTQWGAKNAPKVIATVDGKEEKIFGWDTVATSDEYVNFINQLIPCVIETFLKKGVDKSRLYFHVSDEPSGGCIAEYEGAYRVIESLIEGCEQMDAISNFDFYEKGIIKTPVVSTSSIEPFLNARVKNLWCYYCCAQHEMVSNRFMAMPSYRNRIIGVQMYKYSIVGFLHWGYNFYNLQYSKGEIDPYQITDAGGSFPSGDSFSVYPYKDGATPSFRMKVFKNAIEDIRLLTHLESYIGKSEVIKLIEKVAGQEITFKSYPKNEEFFKKLYKEVFKKLNTIK